MAYFIHKNTYAHFCLVHPLARLPEYKTDGSAAADIYLTEDITVESMSTKLVSSGLIAVAPENQHWELVLRSGSAKKYPGLVLANSVGIIDRDYCGPEDEIKYLLLNLSNKSFSFNVGDRLVQLILREDLKPSNILEMSYEEIHGRRSRGGFGSTGK